MQQLLRSPDLQNGHTSSYCLTNHHLSFSNSTTNPPKSQGHNPVHSSRDPASLPRCISGFTCGVSASNITHRAVA